MNAIEGLKTAGVSFLVRWQAGNAMVDWRTPDASIILDARTVERLAKEGHGSFVAWRVSDRLRGSNTSAAEPVVFRVIERGGLALREFEIETKVEGTGWAPRGHVFAIDAKEALTVAMLAGLTFVREPHAQAKEIPRPVFHAPA